MDAIERIEVSVRTGWAHQMAHKYGAHFHLNRDLFRAKWDFMKHSDSLKKTVSRSNESFIRHLRSKYDKVLPPIWATVEVMTFGQLSNW